MRSRTATEGIGWIGFTLILGAYALTNLQYLEIQSNTYRMMNIVGAIAFLTDSVPDRNWQVIVLNLIWASIGMLAIISSL